MKQRRGGFTKAAALVGALACASIASATLIWSYDNLGPTNGMTNGDRLIRFDSANPVGTVTTIGASNIANVGFSGLDFNNTGTLYAASGFGTAVTTGSLYTVNTATGAATLVGSMGANVTGVTDLSWNPLLGQMQAVASSGGTNTLYTVNLATGAATAVGAISGLPSGALVIGMSTNSAGVNYVHDIVSDKMYVLAGTIATAMSGTIGADTNFSQGMTMNWGGANEWYLGAIGSSPSFFGDVRLMNNATGATTTVLGTWPLHSNGLPEYETGDLAISTVPEPASLLAIGFGLVGLLRKRRK